MLLQVDLHGDGGGAELFYVGAFPGPRVHGAPVAWVAVDSLGTAQLDLPEGRWYLHVIGVSRAGAPAKRLTAGFPDGVCAGSYGGIYGYGVPLPTDHGGEPVRIHISPLWRDLTHLPRPEQPPLSDEQRTLVRAAIDLLAADLAGTVHGDVGPAVGLTRTRLSALFRRATGLTLEEYRIRLRLEAAKDFLVESDFDVLQVALEVGYSTSAQLGRMFQRYLGVSPAEFRRLARAVADGEPARPQVPARSGMARLMTHALLRVRGEGAVIRGEVKYSGLARGPIIYIGAFTTDLPTAYPVAWTSLPGPGPFTLRGVPAGTYYILAAYCQRRMLYPGDFYTSFAYGGAGHSGSPDPDLWSPIPVTVGPESVLESVVIQLVDGDMAARSAGAWQNSFLPDGRGRW